MHKKRTNREILLHGYRVLLKFQHDLSSLLIFKDGFSHLSSAGQKAGTDD